MSRESQQKVVPSSQIIFYAESSYENIFEAKHGGK